MNNFEKILDDNLYKLLSPKTNRNGLQEFREKKPSYFVNIFNNLHNYKEELSPSAWKTLSQALQKTFVETTKVWLYKEFEKNNLPTDKLKQEIEEAEVIIKFGYDNALDTYAIYVSIDTIPSITPFATTYMLFGSDETALNSMLSTIYNQAIDVAK